MGPGHGPQELPPALRQGRRLDPDHDRPQERIYDKPKTPYARLHDTGILEEATRARLEAEHDKLKPARITQDINQIQRQLIEQAKNRNHSTRPAA